MRSIASDKQPNTIGHELTPTPEDDRPINGGQENGKCRAPNAGSAFPGEKRTPRGASPSQILGARQSGLRKPLRDWELRRGHPNTFRTRCRTVCRADIVRRRRKPLADNDFGLRKIAFLGLFVRQRCRTKPPKEACGRGHWAITPGASPGARITLTLTLSRGERGAVRNCQAVSPRTFPCRQAKTALTLALSRGERGVVRDCQAVSPRTFSRRQ